MAHQGRYPRIVEPRHSVTRCRHPHCAEPGMACTLTYDDAAPEFYCSTHAHQHGFCSICGAFWSGIESFDFNNPAGVCEICRDALDEAEHFDDGEESFDEDDL